MAQTLFTAKRYCRNLGISIKRLLYLYADATVQAFWRGRKKFWAESNGLAKNYKNRGAHNVSKDTLYLNHMLTYVREAYSKPINKLLFDLGQRFRSTMVSGFLWAPLRRRANE